MDDEERKIKQAQAIVERRGQGEEKPLLIRDHKLCQIRGYGLAIAKFECEVDGAVITSTFCLLGAADAN